MCGLVGMVGDIRGQEKKMFRDMLVMDQVRGFDSTGICAVDLSADRKTTLLKDVGAAQNLWDYDMDKVFDYRGVLKGNYLCLIGHNRAATVGKVTLDNAHPFNYGHITGAHNGSLNKWDELEGSGKLDVDSKAIFNDIAVNGVDHTWKSFYGAAALTYWDEKEQTLNIIRNSQRPLFYCYSEDQKTMFWASEVWMIWAAASRNNVKLFKKEGADSPNFQEFKIETLYTFKPTATSAGYEGVRELEKKTTFTVNYGKNMVGGRSEIKNLFKGAKKVFMNGEWKSFSERGSEDLKGLCALRATNVMNNKQLGEHQVFRLSIIKEGVSAGNLNIYPTNQRELEYLEGALQKQADGEATLSFELKGKPRLGTNSPQGYVNYHCASTMVKVKVKPIIREVKKEEDKPLQGFLNYNKERVSWDKLQADLKAAGQCCAYCNGSVFAADHKELTWVDKTTVLCRECVINWSNDMNTLKGALH